MLAEKEAKDRRMGLLVNLVEDVTAAVHGRVCASFFSEHRLLFTAMFSMQLQLYNGSAVFSAAEMHFSLYGTVPKHAVPVPTRVRQIWSVDQLSREAASRQLLTRQTRSHAKCGP